MERLLLDLYTGIYRRYLKMFKIIESSFVQSIFQTDLQIDKKLYKKIKEHKITIKEIKSPHSQYVWSNMNDGIFYTLDGVQVTLRHILRSANHSKPTIDATNNFIFSAIERLEEGGTMKDSWETFNQIQDKYIRME